MARQAQLLLLNLSLGLFVLLLHAGCCSVHVSSAGYERRCARPGHRKGSQLELPDENRRQRPEVHYLPKLGVYAVVGHPCHYLRLGRYFRWLDGAWQAAAVLEGPWASVELSELPHGLRGKEPPEEACVSESTARRPG